MAPLVGNQPFWRRKFRGITMVMVVARAWGLLKVELCFLKCYFRRSFKRLHSPGFLEKCNITSIWTCEMKFELTQSCKQEIEGQNYTESGPMCHHVAWWSLSGQPFWFPLILVKSLRFIWKSGTRRSTDAWSSNELQWLDLYTWLDVRIVASVVVHRHQGSIAI